MNGVDYLADTNCFIYLLEGHPQILPFINDKWGFSFITEMELLSKKELTASEDNDIRQLLSSCMKYGHNQSISEIAIILRRKYGLKLPDAIIAATAQHFNTPLLTADKQFGSVNEIDCLLLEI